MSISRDMLILLPLLLLSPSAVVECEWQGVGKGENPQCSAMLRRGHLTLDSDRIPKGPLKGASMYDVRKMFWILDPLPPVRIWD